MRGSSDLHTDEHAALLLTDCFCSLPSCTSSLDFEAYDIYKLLYVLQVWTLKAFTNFVRCPVVSKQFRSHTWMPQSAAIASMRTSVCLSNCWYFKTAMIRLFCRAWLLAHKGDVGFCTLECSPPQLPPQSENWINRKLWHNRVYPSWRGENSLTRKGWQSCNSDREVTKL